MINSLNVFSTDNYVIAEEWNANFKILQKSNSDCADAILDAKTEIAFPDDDLSFLFKQVANRTRSVQISGLSQQVEPEYEYHKILGLKEELDIKINKNMNGESRVIFKINEDRDLKPYNIDYDGTLIENHDDSDVYHAGYYYIMIYEIFGIAFVKLIWTGD